MKKKDELKVSGDLLIEIKKDGKVIETREIKNLVTNLGRAHIANQLSSTGLANPMSHMAIGTGSGQTAASTTLNTESARVSLVSRLQGTATNTHKVIYIAEFGEGVGSGNITEAGIFNASSSGTMLCYTSFSAINKQSNVTITITWTLTISA